MNSFWVHLLYDLYIKQKKSTEEISKIYRGCRLGYIGHKKCNCEFIYIAPYIFMKPQEAPQECNQFRPHGAILLNSNDCFIAFREDKTLFLNHQISDFQWINWHFSHWRVLIDIRKDLTFVGGIALSRTIRRKQ